jgi:hypothetical protein
VQHLHQPNTAAATGYRWFVPLRNTLPNLLLHSLNASVAALVGPGKHHMVWGGAWAIRRDIWETTNLRKKWEGTLSDDLVAARALANSGMKLQFEPACMTASPIDITWRQMFEFVRRQYMVARFYSTTWWLLALGFCTLFQVAFWGALTATIIGAAIGAAWYWASAIVCGVMYATYQVRAALRQDAAHAFLPCRSQASSTPEQFDIWFGPLAGLVNWVCLIGSLFGSRITWRKVTYAMRPGGQISIVGRADAPTPSGSLIPLRKAG